MATYTLSAIDTRGIQDYVFGSNVLRHNIGASELVDRVTRRWVTEALPHPNNAGPDGQLDGRSIERDGLAAEVVYSGGGNAVVLFRTHEVAVAFARDLSRRVLLEAPGLDVVVVHRQFDWDREAVANVLSTVFSEGIRQKRNSGTRGSPILGLGVTADCQFTGRPAVGLDPEGRRSSADVLAKWNAAEDANTRLGHLVGLDGFEAARDFDDFGTPDESSYLAVVHADANGMGKRFQALAARYQQPGQNRAYVAAVRQLSQSVANAAKVALDYITQLVMKNVDPEGKMIAGRVPIRNGRLPFRPLVFGGDDLTFVCDGRLGLTLAATYLQEFAAQTLADGRPASARAGVAIVKTHFPFARAYALAEELTRSAKQRIQEETNGSGDKHLSAIDWHIAASGPVRSLEEIRQREYAVTWDKDASLLMRPLLMDTVGSDWRSWEVFTHLVGRFHEPEWTAHRNQLIALRQVLREGPEAVGEFLRGLRTKQGRPTTLPDVPRNSSAKDDGWIDRRSPYFDAIEALDFYVPLLPSVQEVGDGPLRPRVHPAE